MASDLPESLVEAGVRALAATAAAPTADNVSSAIAVAVLRALAAEAETEITHLGPGSGVYGPDDLRWLANILEGSHEQ